ncbi:MAG: hypothetical protein IJ429_04520 [Lachnospiraceae bacterium]|nr:hypothetical protein [Lachnospiraceae bacterium]
MKQKIQRRDKGYLAWKRKREIIKTAIFFAVPVILFIAGYITTKTRLNLLTVVAVLGMLPASRSLVTLIMYLKSHGITEEDYAVIAPYADKLTGGYDNVFTTYDKTYEVPSVVVRSGNVCGYSFGDQKMLNALEKHLETSIKKDGYSVNVKIFDNIEAYKTRLESLNKLEETQQEKDLAVLQILFDISL